MQNEKNIMKLLYILLMSLASCMGQTKSKPTTMQTNNNANNTFYKFKLKAIDGTKISFLNEMQI